MKDFNEREIVLRKNRAGSIGIIGDGIGQLGPIYFFNSVKSPVYFILPNIFFLLKYSFLMIGGIRIGETSTI